MHIWGMRARLQAERRWRDLALLDVAIDSKLRGCDLVALRLSDVLAGTAIRRRAIVIQQKTGRAVQFEITDQTRQSISRWLLQRRPEPEDWLFPSRMNQARHLSSRQYARLVKRWVALIELDPSAYATHSLRRTKARCFTGKRATLGRASFSWGTRNLRARFATLAWS
jgi:integrase